MPATFSNVLTGAIALEHMGFMILEMVYWNRPLGQRIFQMSEEKAASSAVLAANQGLYNGFLAAGLAWSLMRPSSLDLELFFLGCVLVAGVFGGATAHRSIFFLQALPAILALSLILLHV